MKLARLFGILLGLTLLAGPASAGYVPLSELRDRHPSVEALLSRVPGSTLGADLDRACGIIASLDASGSSTTTDAAWRERLESDLAAALADVREDVEHDLPALDLADRILLAAVLDRTAFDGTIGALAPVSWDHCAGDVDCLDELALQHLDQLARLVGRAVGDAFPVYRHAHPELIVPPPPNASSVDGASFDAWTQQLSLTTGRVAGVESIDG